MSYHKKIQALILEIHKMWKLEWYLIEILFGKIRENEIQNKKYIQNFFMDQSLDFFLEWDNVWWKWKMHEMIQLGYLNVKKKFCASKAIQEDSQESISYKK